MNCAIYKSNRKQDYYLYLECEDDFSRVPEVLVSLLGELEFVMSLELSPVRTLAQADVNEVMKSLELEGYYLQSPPQPENNNNIKNSKLYLKF